MMSGSRERINIVDLFAGPGGLGEGFAACLNERAKPCFKVVLSIEKDAYAHRTLELRSFFRQFAVGKAPQEYYGYLRGEISRNQLFNRWPAQAEAAACQAWHAELGSSLFPTKVVDRRIQRALGSARNWVLIGGPPCQAYSTVGRSRMRGSDPQAFDKDPRHFLYREYLRILAVHAPPVFLMENVKGIISAKVNGNKIFSKILSDLHEPSKCLRSSTHMGGGIKDSLKYKLYPLSQREMTGLVVSPSSFVVKMGRYGIPQDRHRVIILGIREDLDVEPDVLTLSKEEVPAWDAIGDLPKLRSSLSHEEDSGTLWREIIRAIPQSKWIDSDSVDPKLKARLIACALRAGDILPVGGEYVSCTKKPKYIPDWYTDDRLNGVCNHSFRSHIRADIERYFFAACFARVHKRSPLLKDFPEALLPKHGNVKDAIGTGNRLFSDRFRVQLGNRPAATITSHMAKDGHYFIHPDTAQCRSLTVREAARLQTFPDNYFFEGPKTSQYEQVGNAVPPLLAKDIAKIVYKVFGTNA